MNLFEDVALALAQRFDLAITPPIPVGSKHPAEKYADRRRHATFAEIIGWSESHPTWNYGIFTGNIDNRGGVVVVEADDKPGDDVIKARCPHTPFRARSRKSTHYYYRYPVGAPYIASTSKLVIGGVKYNVDIRASFGLVVGPGSYWEKEGQSGTYEMCGDWLELSINDMPVFDPAWLDIKPAEHKTPAPSGVSEFVCARPLDARQQQAREYLMTRPGGREGQGADRYCFALASSLVNGLALSPEEAVEVFLEWGTRADQRDERNVYSPWSKKQLLHKLQDALKKGDNQGRQRGYLLKPDDAAIAAVLDFSDVTVNEEVKAPMEFNKSLVMTGREFRDLAAKDNINWLVDERIEMGGLTIFSGKPYSGKSVVMAHLIGCCLNGSDFFGSPVSKCAVLYLDTDRNRVRRTYNRIARIAADEEIDARFFFPHVDDLPNTLTEETLCLLCKDVVARSPEKIGHLFIVVDTFRSGFLSEKEKGRKVTRR